MEPNHGVTGRSQEPRRRFAEELKSLREQRGDSLRQLGAALGWDWSLFGKLEKGVTLGSVDVVEALDQYYGTSGVLLTLWELAVGDTPQFRPRPERPWPLRPTPGRCSSPASAAAPSRHERRAPADVAIMLA